MRPAVRTFLAPPRTRLLAKRIRNKRINGIYNSELDLKPFSGFILAQRHLPPEEMNRITGKKRAITRRTALGVVGLTVSIGGWLIEKTDEDVAVSIDEECSKASVEMSPPADATWTGVIEYHNGSEVVQTPVGGRTVSGGSSGSLQLSLASSTAHVRRAVVIEGRDLEGPIVREETCETKGGSRDRKAYDRSGTGSRSETRSRSGNEGESSQDDTAPINAESIVRTIREEMGHD